MNARLRWLGLTAGVVVSLSSSGALLQAQGTTKQGKVVSTAAVKGRGAASGADENIKTPRAANDMASKMPAPPTKGGAAARGSTCVVHGDNRTGLYIDFYLDGAFRGTVGPWGDGYWYVGCGATRLYARADYTDGTYSYWGPTMADVDGTFTWRVHP
jgi:hypothetical protein